MDTIVVMKIYFAAAIRGGRDDEMVYRALIDLLAQFGSVLTEHIAHPVDVERGMTDGEIYERDMTWLREADVMVAEVTTPSLGVGYELASAEALGKRALCLFRPTGGRTLSAMVAAAKSFEIIEYETIEDVEEAIKTLLGQASEATPI